MIKCVVGDIKCSGDATWSKWGHRYENNTCSTIEFIVNRHNKTTAEWYNSAGEGIHANPGTAKCHPEWKCNKIARIVAY